MRKLLWFTIGFGGACGLCVFFVSPEGLYPAAFLLLALSLGGWLAGRFLPRVRILALILLGCFCGLTWYSRHDSRYIRPVADLEGTVREVSVTASDYSRETAYGRVVDAMLPLEGNHYPIRVYLEAGEELLPGTAVTGSFRFRLTTRGAPRESMYHASEGIFLMAYQEGEVSFSPGEADSLGVKAAYLRNRIVRILKEYLPEDVYPFAKALLLGDTSDLSYAVDTDLKISGIRHVAAVSGLHVSIVFALISMLTLRKRFLTALVGIPALFLFAALAGFTPSVIRACIMSGLMLIASLINREYDGVTALSFSVLVMLTANPMAVSSVSFQLSVASVAGIFLFSEPIAEWLRSKLGKAKAKSLAGRLKHWFVSSAATSLSAMSLTAPLSAWYFGTVSLVSMATNLVTLWVISFVFYGLMLLCAVSFAGTQWASFLAMTIAWPIRYVLLAANVLAKFPLACIYTASDYVCLWLVFAYVLLAIFVLSRNKHPKQLICCAGIGLCLALLCSWAEPMLYGTSVTVVDVGQGQCVLLQSEGKTYMVDCGGEDDRSPADAAAQLLLSRGISRLDGLIVTHFDRDHAGAVKNLLHRIPTDLIILPDAYFEQAFAPSPTVYADRNLELSWGNSRLTVYGEKIKQSGNENSLCVLFDTEKCDILITSDRNTEGEARLLQTGTVPQVDVLIAGHHGAQDAASTALLEAVRPKTVCISVGYGNIYGHPAPQTLERLHRFGCEIYRTDIHGTVTVRR